MHILFRWMTTYMTGTTTIRRCIGKTIVIRLVGSIIRMPVEIMGWIIRHSGKLGGREAWLRNPQRLGLDTNGTRTS